MTVSNLTFYRVLRKQLRCNEFIRKSPRLTGQVAKKIRPLSLSIPNHIHAPKEATYEHSTHTKRPPSVTRKRALTRP